MGEQTLMWQQNIMCLTFHLSDIYLVFHFAILEVLRSSSVLYTLTNELDLRMHLIVRISGRVEKLYFLRAAEEQTLSHVVQPILITQRTQNIHRGSITLVSNVKACKNCNLTLTFFCLTEKSFKTPGLLSMLLYVLCKEPYNCQESIILIGKLM